MDSEDRGPIVYLKGNDLPGRPAIELFNKIELLFPHGKFFYEYLFMDENYLDRANFRKISKRNIHNIGIVFYPFKHLSISFEVKNVDDRPIEDIIGYPLPGRSIFGTINWSL